MRTRLADVEFFVDSFVSTFICMFFPTIETTYAHAHTHRVSQTQDLLHMGRGEATAKKFVEELVPVIRFVQEALQWSLGIWDFCWFLLVEAADLPGHLENL